jgi:hypothetical protein
LSETPNMEYPQRIAAVGIGKSPLIQWWSPASGCELMSMETEATQQKIKTEREIRRNRTPRRLLWLRNALSKVESEKPRIL